MGKLLKQFFIKGITIPRCSSWSQNDDLSITIFARSVVTFQGNSSQRRPPCHLFYGADHFTI